MSGLCGEETRIRVRKDGHELYVEYRMTPEVARAVAEALALAATSGFRYDSGFGEDAAALAAAAATAEYDGSVILP